MRDFVVGHARRDEYRLWSRAFGGECMGYMSESKQDSREAPLLASHGYIYCRVLGTGVIKTRSSCLPRRDAISDFEFVLKFVLKGVWDS